MFRQEADGEVFWHIGTFDDKLGDNRLMAFNALQKLDERTRRRIDTRINEVRRGIDQGKDPETLNALRGYLEDLDELIWEVEQRKTADEKALLEFLKREEELLKIWQPTLAG